MTFLMSCRRDKSPHCHCHSPASSWERACQVTCNQLLAMVITSTCFPGRGQRKDPSPHLSQKQLLLLFTLYAVWIECKPQPWAFTFLCQFGFCCLTLMLTWGGDSVCFWGSCPALRWQSRIGQVRGWAPRKRSCLKVFMFIRGDPARQEGPRWWANCTVSHTLWGQCEP